MANNYIQEKLEEIQRKAKARRDTYLSPVKHPQKDFFIADNLIVLVFNLI